jgi:hypothetical protein
MHDNERRGGASDATTVAHLSELYQSPRHAAVPDALRFEQLHAAGLHYVFPLEARDRMPRYIQYPGGRGGEAGEPPVGWVYVRDEQTGRECSLRAERGPDAPPRRPGDEPSPSVCLFPSQRRIHVGNAFITPDNKPV